MQRMAPFIKRRSIDFAARLNLQRVALRPVKLKKWESTQARQKKGHRQDPFSQILEASRIWTPRCQVALQPLKGATKA